MFGNKIHQAQRCDTSSVQLKDSTSNVSSFVCKVVDCNTFKKCINIIESNCMRLDSKTFKPAYQLVAVVDNHPIPEGNTRTYKEVIKSEWTDIEVYGSFDKLLNELHQEFSSRVEKYEER